MAYAADWNNPNIRNKFDDMENKLYSDGWSYLSFNDRTVLTILKFPNVMFDEDINRLNQINTKPPLTNMTDTMLSFIRSLFFLETSCLNIGIAPLFIVTARECMSVYLSVC